MKDDMFEQVKYDDYDSDEEEDTDIFSRIINAPTRQVTKKSPSADRVTVGYIDTFAYPCGRHCNRRMSRFLRRTLLRATAGIVLLASIFVGVYLAWENRSGIAEAAMRTKRLAMG